MNVCSTTNHEPPLSLYAQTAREMMTPGVLSIRASATPAEAMALLIDKGISAAPVTDGARRIVGVLSLSDLVVHERERGAARKTSLSDWSEPHVGMSRGAADPNGSAALVADCTLVSDMMTPTVFTISHDAGAAKVVSDLLAFNVHRLFVVENDGTLVGVVTSMDVLRKLCS